MITITMILQFVHSRHTFVVAKLDIALLVLVGHRKEIVNLIVLIQRYLFLLDPCRSLKRVSANLRR